jgi:hypothetical protein
LNPFVPKTGSPVGRGLKNYCGRQCPRLVWIERRHRGGIDFAEGDLLHEAIAAAVTGKNRCPRNTATIDCPRLTFVVNYVVEHHGGARAWLTPTAR